MTDDKAIDRAKLFNVFCDIDLDSNGGLNERDIREGLEKIGLSSTDYEVKRLIREYDNNRVRDYPH